MVQVDGSILHIHLAAMAPQFMHVRTTLPLSEIGKVPGVTVSLSTRQIEMPRLPVKQPKIVILQRMAVADVGQHKSIIRTMIERGWVVVAEADDHPDLLNAVHGLPPNNILWDSIRLAHAAQTSTPELAEAFRPCNDKVVSFANAAYRLSEHPYGKHREGKLRVFFGALNRERFSSQIGHALTELAVRRSDLQFVVVHDRAFFDALKAPNKEFHSALPYERYLEVMEICDIALMPLEGGVGEAYKSDLKFVEASSMGLATIASPPVYGRTILDGVTGVIASGVNDWSTALEALVDRKEHRLRLAAAAYEYVMHHRLFAFQSDHRVAWYRHLWDERIALTRALSDRFRAAA